MRSEPAILAVTNREDVSADLIVLRAARRGVGLFRFNTEDYPVRVRLRLDPLRPDNALLLTDTEQIRVAAARGIWIRRPRWPVVHASLHDTTRAFAQQEAVAAIGGMYRVFANRCVSPPDAMQSARWKVNQLSVAASVGLLVPDTLITNDSVAANEFVRAGRTVAKAVAEARTAGPANTQTGEVFEVDAPLDIESVEIAPVAFQRRIDKIADIRVTVVGRRIFAVRIIVPDGAPVDFRRTDPSACRYEVVELPPPLPTTLIAYMSQFGLRYGAFDFAEDRGGTLWFLECNPAGQWGWLEPFTGLDITGAILDLLLGDW